jgi:hypothetical protein
MFACTISTEGAPSLRFLQGWAAMLLELFHWLRHRPDQTTGGRHFRLPPFAKNAKDGAPRCVGDAIEIKSLGHPPFPVKKHPKWIQKFRA